MIDGDATVSAADEAGITIVGRVPLTPGPPESSLSGTRPTSGDSVGRVPPTSGAAGGGPAA
jgi:hypothetical protein